MVQIDFSGGSVGCGLMVSVSDSVHLSCSWLWLCGSAMVKTWFSVGCGWCGCIFCSSGLVQLWLAGGSG